MSPLAAKIAELKKALSKQALIIKALSGAVPAKPAKVETPKDGETDVKSVRLNANGVKKIREKIGVSQKVFADLIGASLLSVSHWELGKSEPRVAYKRAIAALRGIGKRELAKLFAEKNIAVKEPKAKVQKVKAVKETKAAKAKAKVAEQPKAEKAAEPSESAAPKAEAVAENK